MLTGRLTGRWWLPESPERMLTGTLVLEPDRRPTLEMIGLLEDTSSAELLGSVFGTHVHPTIFGLTTKSREVTLRHALRHVREMHVEDPDGAYVELEASEALIGVHSLSPDDTYSRLSLQLTHLLDWIEPPRVATTYEQVGGRFTGVEHAWRRQPAADLELLDGTVSILLTASESGDGVRERGIRQDARFVVTSTEPLASSAWYERWIKPLRDLITFTTGLPADILHAGLHPSSDGGPEIDWLWRRAGSGPEGERTLAPNEMLFSLLDTGEDTATILGRWLDLAREEQDVINYFLGPRYSKGMYEENRLLNLVIALEALHRRVHGERRAPSRAERDRLARILAACPEPDREWLERQLDYSTRIHLRERLDSIVREHAWLASDVLPKSFIPKVVDARNLHTHLDPTTLKGAPKGATLWPFNEALVVLFEAMVLARLGFDESERERLIRRGSRSYSALKLNPGLMSSRGRARQP